MPIQQRHELGRKFPFLMMLFLIVNVRRHLRLRGFASDSDIVAGNDASTCMWSSMPPAAAWPFSSPAHHQCSRAIDHATICEEVARDWQCPRRSEPDYRQKWTSACLAEQKCRSSGPVEEIGLANRTPTSRLGLFPAGPSALNTLPRCPLAARFC
jgi:hypothetical protein